MRRNPFQVKMEILECLSESALLKTRLMYKVNISVATLGRELHALVMCRMISVTQVTLENIPRPQSVKESIKNGTYRYKTSVQIEQRGWEALRLYQKLCNMIGGLE